MNCYDSRCNFCTLKPVHVEHKKRTIAEWIASIPVQVTRYKYDCVHTCLKGQFVRNFEDWIEIVW